MSLNVVAEWFPISPCHQVPHTSVGMVNPPAQFYLTSFPYRLWKIHVNNAIQLKFHCRFTHLTSGSQLSFNAKLADVWRTRNKNIHWVTNNSIQFQIQWNIIKIDFLSPASTHSGGQELCLLCFYDRIFNRCRDARTVSCFLSLWQSDISINILFSTFFINGEQLKAIKSETFCCRSTGWLGIHNLICSNFFFLP